MTFYARPRANSSLPQHRVFIALMTASIAILSLLPSAAVAQKSSAEAIEQYRSAVALQNQELYDLAAEEWEAFVKKHGSDQYVGNAQHYLGVCYFQTEKYAKADQAFDAAVSANTTRNPKGKVKLSTTLFNQGLARFNLGQGNGKDINKQALQKAVATLRRVTTEFPNDKDAPEAQYYLAESLFALGDKDGAKRLYTDTLRRSPQHPHKEKLLYGLGVAQQETNNSDAARSTFEKLLREFPQSEFADEIITRRADTLFAAKQYAAASTAFATVASKSKSEFADYALLQQAASEFKQKKFAQAGRLYASLVERYPKSEYVPAATLSAGKCLHLGGDANAATWLAKAAKLKGSESLEAAHWLARVQIENGKAADAVAPLQAAIQAASANEKGRKVLPQLRLDLADALYENKDSRGKAAKLYDQIANTNADSEAGPQARYMAAFSAMESGDHNAARGHAQKFLSRYAKDDLRPDVLAIDAESDLQLGNHDSAGQKFEELVKRFSKRPEREAWISRRAICLNRAKKHDDVIRWLGSQIGQIKKADVRGEAEFLLGSAYLNKGDTEKAVQLLQKSLATSPKGLQSDRALLLLSEAQEKGKDPQQALASIRRLIKEHPKSKVASQARFREAELLYAAGDFKSAINGYTSVLQDSKQKKLAPSALFGLAWSHLSLEDYDSAARALDKLTSQHADHQLARKARYAMGVAYQQKGEFDQALRSLDQYLQSDLGKADKADALYLRGLCRAGKNQHKQAASDFRMVMQIDPEFPDAQQVLYELAWSQQDSKQTDQAAASFKQLAEKYPDSSLAAESWYRVAEHQYGKKKYRDAAQAYGRAVKQSKDQPEIAARAAHKLGWAQYQLKKYAEAEQAFKNQLARSKEGKLAATAGLMAAECAYQQKQYDRALNGFRKALPNAQQANAALRSLSMLHAGQAAGQLKDWPNASQMLQKTIQEFPDSKSIHQARYELAYALQQQGQAAKAKPLYEQVATGTTTPVGARARFMLGELQFAEKDYNSAIRTYAKVFSGYGGEKSPKEYHQWQADSLFEAARCCESTKRVESAKRFYQQLIEKYPNSDKAAAARTKLSNLGG